MNFLELISKNKTTTILILLAITWFILKNSIIEWICHTNLVCAIYPNSWPTLLGITTSSSTLLVGLLASVLFALPFGRSGLLTTLLGIQLAQPAFGVIGVILIFLTSSAISIILVHAIVEYGLKHPKASWVHTRLETIQNIFAPAIRKNSVHWLAIGNLVGSQWHMSALGIMCNIPRIRIWIGLFIGNVIGFILLYLFSSIPNLDTISNVLLVIIITITISSPLVYRHWKKR